MTESQLNMSWTVAAANARLNSSRSADCASATSVLVTDVPTFEPMMIGIAGSTPRTARRNTQRILKRDWIVMSNVYSLSFSRCEQNAHRDPFNKFFFDLSNQCGPIDVQRHATFDPDHLVQEIW